MSKHKEPFLGQCKKLASKATVITIISGVSFFSIADIITLPTPIHTNGFNEIDLESNSLTRATFYNSNSLLGNIELLPNEGLNVDNIPFDSNIVVLDSDDKLSPSFNFDTLEGYQELERFSDDSAVVNFPNIDGKLHLYNIGEGLERVNIYSIVDDDSTVHIKAIDISSKDHISIDTSSLDFPTETKNIEVVFSSNKVKSLFVAKSKNGSNPLFVMQGNISNEATIHKEARRHSSLRLSRTNLNIKVGDRYKRVYIYNARRKPTISISGNVRAVQVRLRKRSRNRYYIKVYAKKPGVVNIAISDSRYGKTVRLKVTVVGGKYVTTNDLIFPVKHKSKSWSLNTDSSDLHSDQWYGNDKYAIDMNLPSNKDTGQSVVAVYDGICVATRKTGSNMGWVLLKHKKPLQLNGKTYKSWSTGYMHMKNISCKTGATIKKGKVIGKISNTAPYSLTDHLHFALYKGNTYGKDNLQSLNVTSVFKAKRNK